MAEREPGGRLVALGALAVAVCCGIPLLVAAGALGALTGVGLGNWLVIGAGLVVLAIGTWRSFRRRWPAPRTTPLRDTEETAR